MNYDVLKSQLLSKVGEFVKLAGIITDPDYSKGEMDESNRTISSGTPVSKLPTKFTDARTYPGHKGDKATMKEKLENADGIAPKDWDEKKHGRKLASMIFDEVLKGIDSITDEASLEALVTKCVRETIKKNLSPKETKMDEMVQGTAKPEKGDDDAAGKMVDEKAKKMKGKGKDTKKSAEEPDTLKRVIKMPKENPYMKHYETFGEFAPQGARAAEVDHAISKKKPLKEDLKEEDAQKGVWSKYSDEDYDVADDKYHSQKDDELTNAADKKARKPGGMSDAALDYGKTDDEAAKNWDKKHGKSLKSSDEDDEMSDEELENTFGSSLVRNLSKWGDKLAKESNEKHDTKKGYTPLEPDPDHIHDSDEPSEDMKHLEKEVGRDYKRAKDNDFEDAYVPDYAKKYQKEHGTKKGLVFKSLRESQAWSNPDPSLYLVRPTTTSERREYGARMRFIVDEIPKREPVGSFGNRVVKGAKFNPKKDTLRGDKKLMPKNTVVHDVKNPTKHMDEQLDAAGKRPATVLAHRYKGPKGEPTVQPPHSHGSDGEGFADSEESQKELRKSAKPYGGDRDKPKDHELEPRAYASPEDKFDDAGNYIKPFKQIKVTKEQADLPFKGRAAVKSIVLDVVQEVMKSKFWEDFGEKKLWEDKVTKREDKSWDNQEEPKKKEESGSKKIRAAVLSGETLKSFMMDVVADVISHPEFSLKAEVREGRWGAPVTEASSKHVAEGGKTSVSGKPTAVTNDTNDMRKLFKKEDAHQAELDNRNSKAHAYMDSKKKILKAIVEEVLKGYNPDVRGWHKEAADKRKEDKQLTENSKANTEAIKKKAPYTQITSKETADENPNAPKGRTYYNKPRKDGSGVDRSTRPENFKPDFDPDKD